MASNAVSKVNVNNQLVEEIDIITFIALPVFLEIKENRKGQTARWLYPPSQASRRKTVYPL